MRRIDAEKLFEKLGNIKPKNKQQYEDIGMFMEMVTNSPTVEEQPHGEWKYNPDCVNDEMQAEFFCSICNHGAYSRLDNFCPNCGASMRKLIHGCSFASEECKKNPFADCGVKEGDEK